MDIVELVEKIKSEMSSLDRVVTGSVKYMNKSHERGGDPQLEYLAEFFNEKIKYGVPYEVGDEEGDASVGIKYINDCINDPLVNIEVLKSKGTSSKILISHEYKNQFPRDIAKEGVYID